MICRATTDQPDILHDPAALRTRLRARLLQHCHPLADIDESLDRLNQLLINTRDCQKGQWIMQQREQHGAEQSIRYIRDGRMAKLVVDRFFVEDDTCWVIDYKTAQGEGEDFLREQAELYRDKMSDYTTALLDAQVAERARAALYFPATQTLFEL